MHLSSLGLLAIAMQTPVTAGPAREDRWFIPAPLNYGTWAQEIDRDFPDGDVDGKLARMARVGMTSFFFRRGTPEFHEQLFAAAGQHGIRLHLRTFGIKTLSARDATDHPEWLFTVDWARQRNMACPSWIEVWESDLPEQERFLRENRDHLFGINVDFIRYPDDDPCLCGPCRRLYEEYLGRDRLTEEDLADPALAGPYIRLRCHVIEQMIRRLRAICDRLGLKLSVAVFPNRDHGLFLGQDWVVWAQEGLVDFVCPMSYTADRDEHRRWLQGHVQSIADHAGLWEAVARAWSGGENSPQDALTQSLDVLQAGADGIASYKMAAFTDEDWHLQEGLQAEQGWRLRMDGEVLRIDGPPFGEMHLPPWRVGRCAASGPNPALQHRADGLVVSARRAWVVTDLSPKACRPGGVLSIPVEYHNGTDEIADFRFTVRLPGGWRLVRPVRAAVVEPGSTQSIKCKVQVPEEAGAGDYWVEIDAEDAHTGHFIPRARPVVEADIEGHHCTVIPVSRSHCTSAPTWTRVTVEARQTQEDAGPSTASSLPNRRVDDPRRTRHA